jgi:hypothetical protein
VQVARVDRSPGRAVWRTDCAGLGVGHSEYQHTAKVEAEGRRVTVRSRGSGGSFTEVLDLRSGRRVRRTVP